MGFAQSYSIVFIRPYNVVWLVQETQLTDSTRSKTNDLKRIIWIFNILVIPRPRLASGNTPLSVMRKSIGLFILLIVIFRPHVLSFTDWLYFLISADDSTKAVRLVPTARCQSCAKIKFSLTWNRLRLETLSIKVITNQLNWFGLPQSSSSIFFFDGRACAVFILQF